MTFMLYRMGSSIPKFVHDAIAMTRVGTHTYEFVIRLANGTSKLRVTDVERMTLDIGCLCHSQKG